MMSYIEYLNMPTKISIAFVVLFLVINVIGELLEFKGKVVPEFVKIRKYFKRKQEERETLAEVKVTLAEVKKSLADINNHYSLDNIAMRDGWMSGVNKSLEETDKHFKELDRKMDENNAITMALLIEDKRDTIINFASYAIEEKNPVTREQFNRVFKIHREYETIIQENGMTNGEVDIAIRIIQESYERHMLNHSFVEDLRGYNL